MIKNFFSSCKNYRYNSGQLFFKVLGYYKVFNHKIFFNKKLNYWTVNKIKRRKYSVSNPEFFRLLLINYYR